MPYLVEDLVNKLMKSHVFAISLHRFCMDRVLWSVVLKRLVAAG